MSRLNLRQNNQLERLRAVGSDILDALDSFGRLNRAQLADLIGVSERTVRAAIAVLNADGYPVVSDGTGFVADPTVEQMQRSLGRLESAANMINLRCSGLRRILRARLGTAFPIPSQPMLPLDTPALL